MIVAHILKRFGRTCAPVTAGLLAAQLGVVAALALVALALPQPAYFPNRPAIREALAGQTFLAGAGLRVLDVRLGPGGRAVVRRLETHSRRDADRPQGWVRFDLGDIPTLGLGGIQGEDAQRLNAMIPASTLPLEFGRPFQAPSLTTVSGRRALECLTQAVYFETGRDDEAAQSAVAQVVLNRVRHPAYPASVCGVVYQGALRVTGCQFSFTCDGSLTRGVMRSYWIRAESVARRALQGFVMNKVGVATNYHADYVVPYWARTLVKISTVGPHIFYRWTGPLGQRAAMSQRYAGNEINIGRDILASWDERTQGVDAFVNLRDTVGEGDRVSEAAMRTLQAAGLVAKLDDGRVHALINPIARKPTAEEIKAINEKLAAFEMMMETDPAPLVVESNP